MRQANADFDIEQTDFNKNFKENLKYKSQMDLFTYNDESDPEEVAVDGAAPSARNRLDSEMKRTYRHNYDLNRLCKNIEQGIKIERIILDLGD